MDTVSGARLFDEAVPILDYRRLPSENGVYAIAHESLRFVYVGVTAKSIKGRIGQHIYNAERGWGAPGLVGAWRTYGPKTLRVAVLEEGVAVEVLQDRENFWLRSLEPDYILLNSQKHSNFHRNNDRQHVRGVTYLTSGDARSTILPSRSAEQVIGGGGDVFARHDDGAMGGMGGGGRLTKPFVATAIATADRGGQILLAATYDGRELVYHDTFDSLISHFITRRYKGWEMLLHNADYDMPMEYIITPLLERMSAQGYATQIIEDGVQRKVYAEIKPPTGRETWCIRDTYSLLPMPLTDLAPLAGIGLDKKDIGLKYRSADPTHREYLAHEVHVLHAAYEAYTGTLRECYGISPAYTGGGTALKAFRRMITPQQQRPKVAQFAKRAYFGGLLFMTWVRSHRDKFNLDLNAAFAATMRCQQVCEAGCYTTEEEPNRPGIYFCDVACPEDPPFAFVPARSDDDTIWHSETLRTYLCSNTIALARTLGYSVQVVEGYFF